VEPVLPVDPVGPVNPVDPVVTEAAPVIPVNPVGPVETVDVCPALFVVVTFPLASARIVALPRYRVVPVSHRLLNRFVGDPRLNTEFIVGRISPDTEIYCVVPVFRI
jgi:hypothetical protein